MAYLFYFICESTSGYNRGVVLQCDKYNKIGYKQHTNLVINYTQKCLRNTGYKLHTKVST
jgi:hypothetical protein